jgi:hypothetical protein
LKQKLPEFEGIEKAEPGFETAAGAEKPRPSRARKTVSTKARTPKKAAARTKK